MVATKPQGSPLATPAPWDLVASGYAAELVPLFEHFASAALDLARVGENSNVVDVAAGPGTLAFLAARRGASVCALDFSAEMLGFLQQRLVREGQGRIQTQQGDGQALPYGDAQFDAGFSMFGLMFFPDRQRGFQELARVLRPGAPAVVSSWVNMEKIPQMFAMFSTLAELIPGPSGPPPSALPLVDPERCVEEMSNGGFTNVVVHEITGESNAPSTRELVEFVVRTSAPVLLRKKALGDAWGAVEAQLIDRMEQRFGKGPQKLKMPANLTYGVRAH